MEIAEILLERMRNLLPEKNFTLLLHKLHAISESLAAAGPLNFFSESIAKAVAKEIISNLARLGMT